MLCLRTLILLFLLGAAANAATDPADSVTRVPRARILDISRQIDELVEKRLFDAGTQPNPPTDDQVFLRRVYLDIAGRIPTLDEAQAFLSASSKHKRAELIDELLDSSAYASHAFNYWADVLRIKSRLQGGNPGLPYIEFVKASLTANKPFDVFVRELLVAEGAALERGNGATGYYLRDEGMPEDNMANTVRVFLGTRLECAQCHDHPFDEWTQREFFEMVAFTGGMRTRTSPTGTRKTSADLRKQLRNSDANAKVKQAAQRLLRPLSFGVSGGGTGLARLPDSYQYDDGEPNEIVKAKTLFEHRELVQPTIPPQPRRQRQQRKKNARLANIIPGARDIGSRAAFAEWLTAPANPRFTQVIVNRLWKKSMGLGLIEPVDDLTKETQASNPALLEYLTRQMIELGYDMRQFQRAIYNSRTYQRIASAMEVDDYLQYHFPGPLLRRLTAEQLWDSFLTLAVPNLDNKENPRNQLGPSAIFGAQDIYAGYEQVQRMSVDELIAVAEKQVALQADPQARREQYRQLMMSADQDANPYEQETKQLRQKLIELRRLQQQARQNRKPVVMRQLQQQIREVQTTLRHLPARTGGDLVRASELPSPAPPGHFLREFGQSDRETIENANAEPAVSQVLSLMNGTIEQRIISNPRTVLMSNLVAADSPAKKIDTVFLSMLSRFPTRDERAVWLAAASADGEEAANDLIWTLANTSEFMFVR